VEVNTFGKIHLTGEQMDINIHRDFVGGMWDELGRLQTDFLIAEGLKSDMRFLDIGCGCLRDGVHLIRFLLPGNYFGLDISESLLQAGYDIELPKVGLQEKLPRSNLFTKNIFAHAGWA